MGGWASYGLGDFLMFSPEAWGRLVQRYNEAWWPAQMLAVAAGLLLVVLTPRRSGLLRRPGLMVLGFAWLWTAWAFHWQRHGELFIAAPQLAWAAGVQGVLLLAAAFSRLPQAATGPVRARLGQALVAFAVLGWPLLAPTTGQGWRQAEVFGFMPDPTALATLGWLLASSQGNAWLRGALALLPLAFLLFGLATRWTLGQYITA